MRELEEDIAQITVVPSTNGIFDVSVDGRLVFSKDRSGRYPQPGELVRLVSDKIRGSPT